MIYLSVNQLSPTIIRLSYISKGWALKERHEALEEHILFVTKKERGVLVIYGASWRDDASHIWPKTIRLLSAITILWLGEKPMDDGERDEGGGEEGKSKENKRQHQNKNFGVL